GRVRRITGKRSRTRSNRSPLSAAMVSGAENAGDHGLRISLGIPNDRVYEPYAPGFRSPARTPWPPWTPHTRSQEKLHTPRAPLSQPGSTPVAPLESPHTMGRKNAHEAVPGAQRGVPAVLAQPGGLKAPAGLRWAPSWSRPTGPGAPRRPPWDS